MIKKLVTFITAAMLALALSGNALAEFADLHLIRIYYDRAGDEIATDLGLVKDILATPSSTFPGSFGSLSTGYSVYFALDRTTGMSDLWATGSTITPSTIIGTSVGLTSLKSGTTNMYSWYNGFAIGDTYTGPASAINSFKNKLSATQGSLANSIAAVSRLNTEASIASLITNGSGSVTQTLYFWDNALTTVATEKIGVAVATITTNFDGTTTISNQVADSFPPAVTIATPPLSPSTSATVSISFTATDAVGVTGYLLNESATPPLADDAGWVAVTPSTSFSTATPIDYTFSGLVPGVLTTKWLYVWAKDAAGNVSAQAGTYTDITIPAGGATPTIIWATPAAITYGTALSVTQLNATASDPVTAAVVPGTFDYNPALGAILNAGTQALSVTFTPTDTAAYTAANSTVNLTVNQATPTITWATPTSITYGTPISAAQLNATASVPGTFAYNVALGDVLAAGTQTLSVIFTPTDSVNYSTATASVNQVVNKAALSVTANNLSRMVNTANPPLTYTVTGFVNGETAAVLTGAPVLNTTATTSSPAGTYPISVTAGTLAAANYSFSLVNGTLTVTGQNVPTITWATPTAVTYGTALSATQLNATASVPGTFAYTPALGNVPNSGTQVLSVTFTPTDSVNYATATDSVNLVVNKAALTVTANNLSRVVNTANPPLTYTVAGFVNGETAAVLTGAPVLSTTAVTNSPAGSYPITVTAGTLAAANYSFSLVNGTLTVTGQNVPTITWATPTAVTYGTALSATQLNATASVPGTFAYTPALGSVPAAGTQTISVTFTPNDSVNYSTVTDSVNLVVNRATLTITANNLSKVVNTANPTLTYTVAGFVNGENTSVLIGTPELSTTAVKFSPVGSYPITVTTGTLIPVNYSFTFVNGTLTITGQTVPTVTWNAPASITYGTALSTTQLNATASVPGTFAYTPAPGSVPVAGTQTLSVTFTPTDSVNYSTVTDSVNLVVNRATLTVTANNLSRVVNTANPPLTYKVDGFVNNETTTVITGAPALSTTAVTNSPVGSYPITVTAGTLAAANYSFSFVNGTLTITGQTVPTVTWNTPAAITYGTTLSATQLNATANVPGTFAYTPAPGSVPVVGTQVLSVTFTPTDSVNYSTVTDSVNLVVNRATLTVTANNLSRMVNTANPTLTYNVTGFVNAETAAVLSGAPALSTTAVTGSPVGSYPITVTAGTLASANYSFNLVNGTLTVTNITLAQNPVMILGDKGYATLFAAIQAVSADATILVRDTYTSVLPEALLLNNGFNVTLNGGMDVNGNPTTGYSTVKGTLTIQSGALVVNGVAIW